MSLYHIEEELLRIFANIEENDGEVSEELWAELEITKENLKGKLDNYIKAIKSWDGDVTIIKDEVKKLNNTAKVRTNRIDRLKKAMLTAVLLFGEDGKSGNKFIELATVRVFSKGTNAVDTNELRITALIGEFERFVRELVDNDILYTGNNVELQAILDVINTNLKAEHETTDEDTVNIHRGNEFIPYTLTDLTTLKIEITTTKTVYELFRGGREALVLYGKDPIHTQMRNHTAKEDWKTAIEVVDRINKDIDGEAGASLVSYPTVAKIVKNQSIQMK